MRMERIIQDKIHLFYTMHEAFILIKLEVVTNVHALIDVRVYRQACIYHINYNKDEVTTSPHMIKNNSGDIK